jgi:hypothetical protein
MSIRGSRFLKFENRNEELTCGSNSKKNLLNAGFSKFSAVFFTKMRI